MSKRSGRTVGSARSQGSSSEADTVQDCKAAFLVIFDDLEDEIESKDQLEEGNNMHMSVPCTRPKNDKDQLDTGNLPQVVARPCHIQRKPA